MPTFILLCGLYFRVTAYILTQPHPLHHSPWPCTFVASWMRS